MGLDWGVYVVCLLGVKKPWECSRGFFFCLGLGYAAGFSAAGSAVGIGRYPTTESTTYLYAQWPVDTSVNVRVWFSHIERSIL